MGGMKPRLPNPTEMAVIKAFLAESTGLHIDHVEFGRPASGVSMRVHYRDFKGFSRTQSILAPDEEGFEDIVVSMSDVLEANHGLKIVGKA